MFPLLKLFRKLFGPWVMSAPIRLKPRRIVLSLEGLEERWCPATATWDPQIVNGQLSTAWNSPANWEWSDQTLDNNYPGDTATRTTDIAAFNGTSSSPCQLSVNLPGTLDGLYMNNAYLSKVSIGANVKVSGSFGFDMEAGTLDTTGGNLTIGPATGGAINYWTGGTIAGNGTVAISGGELDIKSSASSLAANLVISQDSNGNPGIVKLINMFGNLALSGSSNGIDVQNGGELILDNSNTDSQANQAGGITGGVKNLITIDFDGFVERGTGTANPSGCVLISTPVLNNGGTFLLWDSNAATPSRVDLTGTDSAGYSYDDFNSGAADTLEVGQRAALIASNGIRITNSGILKMDVGSLGTPSVSGNVLINGDGTLELADVVAGTTGAAQFYNNVTLTANSTLEENWNGNTADLLKVTGNLSLGNATLLMNGATPPTKGDYVNIIDSLAAPINGNFSAFIWAGHAGTIFNHQIESDGWEGYYYQIAQESV